MLAQWSFVCLPYFFLFYCFSLSALTWASTLFIAPYPVLSVLTPSMRQTLIQMHSHKPSPHRHLRSSLWVQVFLLCMEAGLSLPQSTWFHSCPWCCRGGVRHWCFGEMIWEQQPILFSRIRSSPRAWPGWWCADRWCYPVCRFSIIWKLMTAPYFQEESGEL